MAFIGVAFLLVSAGFWYYSMEISESVKKRHESLSSIGELKAKQVEQWRADRKMNARELAHDPFSRKAVQEFLRSPNDAKLRANLQELLNLEKSTSGADDVLLLAPSGAVLLAASSDPLPSTSILQRAIEAGVRTKETVISDFYRGQNGEIYVDAVEIMRDAQDQPLGVVDFRTNPKTFLYPLIQHWPTPSLSAETILVQREGEEVVFLNKLRHLSHAALSLKEPLTHLNIPAVQAVLGKQGIFEGKDYRGIPVLSDLRPISNSPWFIVAKIDSVEIFAEARYRAILIIIIMTLVILLFAGSIAFIDRQKKIEILRKLFESERMLGESQAKQLAAQRMLADEQIKLQATLVDLERANREKEEFIYSVSHDLKSPLITVKTFLGYLENDLLSNKPEEVSKDFGYIHTAADKMGRMLQELLELASVGRAVENHVEVSLQQITHEALELLAGQISARGVQVQVTQEPVWLYGDHSRLVAVFQNLVDNAVKFLGDQPSPKVEIGVSQVGLEIVIFVRDNGKGIAAPDLSKIFRIFNKLDAKAPGSGLGLAVVRRIVELHGGKIWVESEGQGLGTVFNFTLRKTQIK